MAPTLSVSRVCGLIVRRFASSAKGAEPTVVVQQPRLYRRGIKKGDRRSNNADFITYKALYTQRHQEAKRSILVQVPTKLEGLVLKKTFQKFGTVRNTFHFCHIKEYMLIEFENIASIPRLLSSVGHFKNDERIPAETRLLYLLSSERQYMTGKGSGDSKRLDLAKLALATSVTEQMNMVYNQLKLTDLEQRLRFFICSNLEDMLLGLFPKCCVYPFGSTANGFGHHDCDLDMIIDLCPPSHQERNNSTLKFLTKRIHEDERSFSQRHLFVIANMIQNFIPSCPNVHRILNARVPIVKFFHEAVNVECDLSLKNTSGVAMSELLYLLGELDHRVRPLVLTVRLWAKLNDLTKKIPGPQPSNFMLTMLIIFFLQTRPEPILPAIRHLKQLTGPADLIVDNGIDCSFVQDIKHVPMSKNTENLGDLLLEFFAFYAVFNFKEHGISTLDGSDFQKTDFSPIYVKNPLDLQHNVCRNVSGVELQRFLQSVQTAAWNLEKFREKDQDCWGLLSILKVNTNTKTSKANFKVVNLFRNDASESGVVN